MSLLLRKVKSPANFFVLLTQLKDDAVSLVDAIAPPDFILNAPIARADGEVYLLYSIW